MSVSTDLKKQLERHAVDERRKATKKVIQLIGDVLDGRHSDSAVIAATIQAAGLSPSQYIDAVKRADTRQQLAKLNELQQHIEAEVAPVIDQIESEVSAFEQLRVNHEEKLFALRCKIETLREPVSRLEALKQEVNISDRGIPVPEALLISAASREKREQLLLKEQRQNRQPRSRPEGADVTPAEIDRWHREECLRVCALSKAQIGLAVMREFHVVVREKCFDEQTGIWLPIEESDLSDCEGIAAARVDPGKSSPNVIVDSDEPPEMVSMMGAGASAQAD